MTNRLPIIALAPTTLWILAFAGCGESDRVSVYPVQGKVMYQGQPAASAEVVFHSADTSTLSATVPIPRGTVQRDGTFELTSYEDGDGAPAGAYDVTIVWHAHGADASVDPESSPAEVDRLGGRYANPDMSGLTATVLEGPTQLEPFELK